MLALAGEQDDGCLAAALDGEPEEGDPVFSAEPVIDKANVVLVARHRIEAAGEVLHPLDLAAPALHFREESLGQDEIILIILDQQDSHLLVRTHNGSAGWRSGFPGGKLDNFKPVTADGLHDIHQGFKGDRL